MVLLPIKKLKENWFITTNKTPPRTMRVVLAYCYVHRAPAKVAASQLILWICVRGLTLQSNPDCSFCSALGTVNQSLKAGSDADGNGPASCWSLLGGRPGSQLSSRCCGAGDCSAARIDTKAALPRPFVSSSSLPSWLQHCRDHQVHESKRSLTCMMIFVPNL
jgi:hypothetical protein